MARDGIHQTEVLFTHRTNDAGNYSMVDVLEASCSFLKWTLMEFGLYCELFLSL